MLQLLLSRSLWRLGVHDHGTPASNLHFAVTNVYGPLDHSLIDLFLRDLHDVAATINDPWLLIGDFDLTRSPNDKNSMTFNANLASRFNQAVDTLQLVKLPLLDRMFTWTNKRAEPTLSRLDRAFFNLSFGEIFPATSLTSGCRPTSDHNPIIASIQTNIPKPMPSDWSCLGS